jgi:hypothetical protein
MSEEFRTLFLEGIFYRSGTPYPDAKGALKDGFEDLRVQPPTGHSVPVYDALKEFVGRKIRLSAHQMPTKPIDPARWGGGCCLWQPVGYCPYGHHKRPGRLYNQAGEGELVYKKCSGGWALRDPDGAWEMVPLSHALDGHVGRIVVATVLSPEQLREAVSGLPTPEVMAELEDRITGLQSLVGKLSRKL